MYIWTVLRPDNGRCPAVTIDVLQCHSRVKGKLFSVDVVPAVRLLEWPWPARRWSSLWLPKDVTDKIRNPSINEYMQPCIVPKIHNTGACVGVVRSVASRKITVNVLDKHF